MSFCFYLGDTRLFGGLWRAFSSLSWSIFEFGCAYCPRCVSLIVTTRTVEIARNIQAWLRYGQLYFAADSMEDKWKHSTRSLKPISAVEDSALLQINQTDPGWVSVLATGNLGLVYCTHQGCVPPCTLGHPKSLETTSYI